MCSPHHSKHLEFLTQQKSQQHPKIGTFLVHPSQNHLICPPKLYHPLLPPFPKRVERNHHPPKPHIRPPRNHIHCYPPTALRIKDLSPCCDLNGDHDGWMTWGGLGLVSHGEHNFGWQACMCWTSLGFLAGELVKWNDLTLVEFFCRD